MGEKEELFDVEEFWKFKMRIGFVKSAEKVPKSRKLIKLTVDFGDEERTIVAGIGDQYEPKDLEGKKMIFVVNLKPKKLMGVESQGMLVVAEDEEGKVYLITAGDEVPVGSKVW
ncbi:MAG: methionine--tRNA ligase subunit beta [Candidatus Baldrarchaeia archaeon]|mgnify:CR=1 FL=1